MISATDNSNKAYFLFPDRPALIIMLKKVLRFRFNRLEKMVSLFDQVAATTRRNQKMEVIARFLEDNIGDKEYVG